MKTDNLYRKMVPYILISKPSWMSRTCSIPSKWMVFRNVFNWISSIFCPYSLNTVNMNHLSVHSYSFVHPNRPNEWFLVMSSIEYRLFYVRIRQIPSIWVIAPLWSSHDHILLLLSFDWKKFLPIYIFKRSISGHLRWLPVLR